MYIMGNNLAYNISYITIQIFIIVLPKKYFIFMHCILLIFAHPVVCVGSNAPV